jgi:hypothetical protein
MFAESRVLMAVREEFMRPGIVAQPLHHLHRASEGRGGGGDAAEGDRGDRSGDPLRGSRSAVPPSNASGFAGV